LAAVNNRPEVVFQWVQGLIVSMIETEVLSVPAPLLTRVFQDLGNGMSKYHQGLKFPDVPVPFPYVAAAEMTLYMHTVITPIVSIQWSTTAYLPPLFTCVLVFILWSLFIVAGELENPFNGDDANDLDMDLIQAEVNAQLMTLLQGPSLRLPKLRKSAHEASSRLSVQSCSRFDKSAYLSTHTRAHDGKAWGDVVHSALSEKRLSSNVLHPCRSDNTGMSAFFDNEPTDVESSENSESSATEPPEPCHIHMIRPTRQPRRVAKMRSLQKNDQVRGLDFDRPDQDAQSDFSGSYHLSRMTLRVGEKQDRTSSSSLPLASWRPATLPSEPISDSSQTCSEASTATDTGPQHPYRFLARLDCSPATESGDAGILRELCVAPTSEDV